MKIPFFISKAWSNILNDWLAGNQRPKIFQIVGKGGCIIGENNIGSPKYKNISSCFDLVIVIALSIAVNLF